MLYVALGCFIGTSLALAASALLATKVGVVATLLAIIGMACLLGAAIAMGREVSMAVRSLDTELDITLAKRRRGG
jgi:protein-S-isoprenylcysteine O-methyltransferase Ste14